MDNTVNRPIKMEDLQIGDEVIVRGVDLNYMQIVRPPMPKQYKDYKGSPYTGYTSAVCNRINSKFIKSSWAMSGSDDKQQVRFDFSYKSIWLVKRGDNN